MNLWEGSGGAGGCYISVRVSVITTYLSKVCMNRQLCLDPLASWNENRSGAQYITVSNMTLEVSGNHAVSMGVRMVVWVSILSLEAGTVPYVSDYVHTVLT